MPGAIPRAVHATVRVREIGRNAIQQRLPYRRRTRATVPVAQDAGIALLHHLLHVGLARPTPPQVRRQGPAVLGEERLEGTRFASALTRGAGRSGPGSYPATECNRQSGR